MSSSAGFCEGDHTLRREVRDHADNLSLIIRKQSCEDCPYWRSESVPVQQVTLGEVLQ